MASIIVVCSALRAQFPSSQQHLATVQGRRGSQRFLAKRSIFYDETNLMRASPCYDRRARALQILF